MNDEQEHQPPISRHAEVFGLMYTEDLFNTLSDARLKELINVSDSDVLEASVSTNAFGEYLFLTLRKVAHGQLFLITAYGLGFHEQRECWITDSWRWYSTHERGGIPLSKERVLETIRQRRDEITSYAEEETPSESAMMFSLLADLSDEDDALSMLNDMGI